MVYGGVVYSVKHLVRAARMFSIFSSRNFSGGFLRGGCNLFEINFMRVILSSNDDEAVFPKIVSLVLFCSGRGKTTHDD